MMHWMPETVTHYSYSKESFVVLHYYLGMWRVSFLLHWMAFEMTCWVYFQWTGYWYSYRKKISLKSASNLKSDQTTIFHSIILILNIKPLTITLEEQVSQNLRIASVLCILVGVAMGTVCCSAVLLVSIYLSP